MTDYLFRGALRDVDPDVFELAQLEAERQYRKLILIASESTAPQAVREALSTTFQNIYAEGYPDDETRRLPEAELLDYDARLAHFYTIITRDTQELDLAHNRQLFLAEQGYSYRIWDADELR